MTFHPRQRIQHKTLGAGTVVEVAGDLNHGAVIHI